VIAEDLLEGVFVDPLPCGGHRARLYHVLAAEASWFFPLLSPSLPSASPVRAGRREDFEKGNSYTLELSTDEHLQEEITQKAMRKYLGNEGEQYVDAVLQDGKSGKNRVIAKVKPEHIVTWDFRKGQGAGGASAA